MFISIPNLESLEEAVLLFFEKIKGHKKIVFYGEIGTGKTTFIKQLCQHIGVYETVASPTFSIINEYSYTETSTAQLLLIYHIDLYRLKTIDEALDIGIEDYLYNPYYCFIEWPDLIEPILPDDCIKIKLEIDNNSIRKIVFL